jgi:5-formaminoimidazole-4-carboxamide-1-beta-D-ribofuranosyl 5'-monophosphate synthetase
VKATKTRNNIYLRQLPEKIDGTIIMKLRQRFRTTEKDFFRAKKKETRGEKNNLGGNQEESTKRKIDC